MEKGLLILSIFIFLGLVSFIYYSNFEPYKFKNFANRHLGTTYRLDIYPQFFDLDENAWESAQKFNSGEISYLQYAGQRGHRIITKPIIRDIQINLNGSGAGGYVNLNRTGGAGGYVNPINTRCTTEWFTVDEEGNLIAGPGGCF